MGRAALTHLAMKTPVRSLPSRKTPPPRKSSATPILLLLLLLGGGIGGYAWYRHNQAPVPKPVAAVRPPPPAEDYQPPPPYNPNVPPADNTVGQMQIDPAQIQALMQQNMQQMTAAMYGDLFAQMNLSPEQRAQVDALMAQRAQAVQAYFQNAFQQGGFDPANVNPAQIAQQIDQLSAPANQALQAALGDANYQQLQARDQQVRQSYQQVYQPGGGLPAGPGAPGGPGGQGPGQ